MSNNPYDPEQSSQQKMTWDKFWKSTLGGKPKEIVEGLQQNISDSDGPTRNSGPSGPPFYGYHR
jgi:hypothetical protein